MGQNPPIDTNFSVKYWDKSNFNGSQKNYVDVIKYIRQKKVVVFQVPCQKKTGSVGRLYFSFLLTVQNSSFPPKKYRQCHQAVDPGDIYYGRSFINSGKSRSPRTLPKGTP